MTVMFATFRERILTIPGKIASACEGRTREEIEEIIRGVVFEMLDELADPTKDAARGGGIAEPDAA
jgi:hypothetical protein